MITAVCGVLHVKRRDLKMENSQWILRGASKATVDPSTFAPPIYAAMNSVSKARSVQPQVAIRFFRGDGLRTLIVQLGTEASAENLTVGHLKEIICNPPHSICADGASSLVLVLKGLLLTDETALADLPLAAGTFVTAVILSASSPSSRQPIIAHHRLQTYGTHSAHPAAVSRLSLDACVADPKTTIPPSYAALSPVAGPAASLLKVVQQASPINKPNLTLVDPIIQFQSSPAVQEKHHRWGEVQKFYLNHVAGDGTFDSLLLPSTVSEFDLKLFAACEHVLLPGLKLREDLTSQSARNLVKSMDVVDFLVMLTGQPELSVDNFRCERHIISGLKNATWLNGAEGLIDDQVYDSSSPAIELWLYWPPDAVQRNGGKKAKINRANLSLDYAFVFERHPERCKSAIDQAVGPIKSMDPICHIFVSLIDFDQVSDWYKPSTLIHFQEATLQRMETETRRVLALPEVQKRLSSTNIQKSFDKNPFKGSDLVAGILFRCFMDCHPELQREVDGAISLLSHSDADACVKSLMRALDLMPLSDNHISDKLEDPMFSDGKATVFSTIDNLTHAFGSVAVDQMKSWVQSRDGVDWNFSEIKQKINRVLEMFLFLICQDQAELLRLFATQQFLVGVYEQSGGNYLLHLLSFFEWKCDQNLQGKYSALDWSIFKPKFNRGGAYLRSFPKMIPVLLHSALCSHRARCGCMGDVVWFPCDWPPYITAYLLSFQCFRNLERDPRLRRMLCHYHVFLELKPRVFDQPFESIFLIKFFFKLCFKDLSDDYFDNVVEGPLLLALEDDLKKEALGRAVLAVDSDAVPFMASFFAAEELDCILRYTHIKNADVTCMPVRISGMQKDIWMNGATGTSDLIPDPNGCVLVRVLSPADVVASCKGVARVVPAKVEVLGLEIPATVFVSVYSIQTFIFSKWDSVFKGFCKVMSVMIQKQCGAGDVRATPFLSMLRCFMEDIPELVPFFSTIKDFMEDIPELVPFFSTIKDFIWKVIPGVHLPFRLLNPLTRPHALHILFTQLQVLVSFISMPKGATLLPVVTAILDKLKSHLDSEVAQQVIPVLKEMGQQLEKLSGVSSFEEFWGLMSNSTFNENGFSRPKEFAIPFDFLSALKEAFPEFSALLGQFEKGGSISNFQQQYEENYEIMKQSGMSPSVAKVAAIDKAIMAIGPLEMLKFQRDIERLKSNVPLPAYITEVFDKQQDMIDETYGRRDAARLHPCDVQCAADIVDSCELATEQRVRVKKDLPDDVPAFLAAAEGVIHKCSDASSQIYCVLVQKPAAAVLQCNDSCLYNIDKKHLMVLGKLVPKINFATDWIDEEGCLQKKIVSYWSTCPKSHPLHFCEKPSELDERINFCIICDGDLCSSSRYTCSLGCAYSVCEQCHDIMQNPIVGATSSPSNDEHAYVHVFHSQRYYYLFYLTPFRVLKFLRCKNLKSGGKCVAPMLSLFCAMACDCFCSIRTRV